MVAEWWGDWSSLIGVMVGLAGFGFTIFLLFKSKSASEAARAAAENAVREMRRTLTLTDITATIQIAKEIRRLQRAGQWDVTLERYTELKTLIVRVREENPNFTTEERSAIQDIIAQIRSLENAIEKFVSAPGTQHNLARWNRILSGILETLESLSISTAFTGDIS